MGSSDARQQSVIEQTDAATVRLLPYHFAKAKGIITARTVSGEIEVWLAPDPASSTLSEVRRMTGKSLKPVLLSKEEFASRLSRAYGGGQNESGGTDGDAAVQEIASNIENAADLAQLTNSLPEVTDLLETENDAPIIKLINALLTQAVRENASDIHLEIFERRSLVRFRVDGALRDVVEPKRSLHAVMVSRVKVMAELDIAEKRLPQDGRIMLRIAGHPVDVRVSTLPTGHGERVVLRLLDKQAGRLSLNGLGMSAPTLGRLDNLIQQPHGIILVTGPTGSGKTTTLYAALSRLDATTRNMMTVEDPIEYDLDGVGQTQVNPKIDMTFARALRAILRQDPDVIMIGEIRDLETAQIAVQASLTGHLVLATLHTNSAAGAVTRLVDMGIEPFLLASTLSGVLAQRLVRKLAPGSTDQFRGRTGIYELLSVDESLRKLIHDGASEREIAAAAEANGMVTLRQDGMRWVEAGVTSQEEVLRVTRD
ncbi:MAG: Flp pilus assembly complex ATPase component TadA [Betaproteobacteria bacterium]|nr:Flp pilus assembly complex ATPase component TadA [Betaproteobacteria bacterium]